MKKELKKCYNCLDLEYSATVEEVKVREKALLKILNSTVGKKSCEKEILNVKKSAREIIENIKNNGIPNEERHRYETSGESIIGLLIVLLFAIMICVLSFHLYL